MRYIFIALILVCLSMAIYLSVRAIRVKKKINKVQEFEDDYIIERYKFWESINKSQCVLYGDSKEQYESRKKEYTKWLDKIDERN